MSIKRYIGNKHFYKNVILVALPIMLQNMVTNLVDFVDNIMVGRLSTEAVSAVGIINQLMLVYYLLIFGALSGIGIFTVQFFGKGDESGVKYTFRFKIIAAVVLSILAFSVFRFADTFLISRFINEGSQDGDLGLALALSKEYLAIVMLGMLPYAITQCYAGTLRETGDTLPPMIVSIGAVFLNLIFNYILIFGKIGFQPLGVEGAAIATLISRICECGAIVLFTHLKRKKFTFIRGVFKSMRVPKVLVKEIFKRGTPLVINETLWSLGTTVLARLYSVRGLAVFTGYNIAATVTNLFSIGFISLGMTVGIIVGQYLGAGKFDEAKDADTKLLAFTVFVAVITGATMALLAPFFPQFYTGVSSEAKEVATYMMLCASFLSPVNAFMNACYFTLRSGGKTWITFVFDGGSMWLLYVPVAMILVYLTDLTIFWIFPIVNSLEIIKCMIGYIMLKKNLWINNITVEA